MIVFAMQISAEQQIVVRPREMPDEVLQIDEVGRRAEAARERIVRGGYHATVHRAEMLKQMRFLLEHGNAESTCEWFLARVHS